jgi:hypothetical protein
MSSDKQPDKIAGTIQEGADSLAQSKAAFRRDWINTGRIKTFDFGGRSEVFLWADLHAAVARRTAEQVAHPELKRLQSTGARLKAAGRVGNPWGRNGKPPEMTVAKAKGGRK